jgi:hypothetical protein
VDHDIRASSFRFLLGEGRTGVKKEDAGQKEDDQAA